MSTGSNLDVPFEDFDPNNLPESIWASYVASWRRGGKFKMHTKRGLALNACNREHQSKLFEFEGGRWHLRATWDIDAKLKERDKCEVCNKTYVLGTPPRYSYEIARDRPYERVMRRKGKVVWPLQVLVVCGECVRGMDL
jgi:hypothetical protein